MRHSRKKSDCGCGKPEPKEENLYELMKSQCDLQALTEAVDSEPAVKAALETLPLTLLAPDDRAFCKATPCAGLSLEQVLLYHAVTPHIKTKDMTNNQMLDTKEGRTVRVNKYSGPVFRDVITFNGAKALETDLKASNGYLNKISQVLCPPTQSILELAIATPELSKLVEAVIAAGPDFVETLAGLENATLFAPTNEAFERVDKTLRCMGSSLDALLADQEALTKVLLYHVLGSIVFSAALHRGCTPDVETVEGSTVDIEKKIRRKRHCDRRQRKRKVVIDVIDDLCRNARVQQADLLATNGVFHVVDRVLLPDIEYPPAH